MVMSVAVTEHFFIGEMEIKLTHFVISINSKEREVRLSLKHDNFGKNYIVNLYSFVLITENFNIYVKYLLLILRLNKSNKFFERTNTLAKTSMRKLVVLTYFHSVMLPYSHFE